MVCAVAYDNFGCLLVGERAFAKTDLTTVKLPEGLEVIRESGTGITRSAFTGDSLARIIPTCFLTS